MPFTQRIHPPGHDLCDGHDPAGCTVIDCLTGEMITEPVSRADDGRILRACGTEIVNDDGSPLEIIDGPDCTLLLVHFRPGDRVWHSHMDAAICPEHRLNKDHPAEDHRGAEPVPVTVTAWCGTCLAHPAVAGTAR